MNITFKLVRIHVKLSSSCPTVIQAYTYVPYVSCTRIVNKHPYNWIWALKPCSAYVAKGSSASSVDGLRSVWHADACCLAPNAGLSDGNRPRPLRLLQTNCCTSRIMDSGVMCSTSNAAPCIIDNGACCRTLYLDQ